MLGLVPRPVVEDVTAYVRSSRMGGRAFLRLSEKDLERQGLNLKWRKLMVEAGRKLRRDALRGRIWGYESGSLRWPKSAQDLEREEADEEAQQEENEDGVIRSTKTTSKLTLKRMRDSRKVRGMIQAFQTSPDKEDFPSPNLPADAPYGLGYVRGQAQQILSEAEQQKKLSLRRPLRPRRSTADFPWLESESQGEAKREDIEALLASLNEQEANELANELGLSDLQDRDAVSRAFNDSHTDGKQRRQASGESADEVVLMPTLTRHASTDSTSIEGDSSLSECSGTESEMDFTEDGEQDGDTLGDKPRYGVLDEDIIRAILAEEDTAIPVTNDAESKNQLTRSHTTASIVRPGRPYRASMYTDDELAALTTDTAPLYHTRTESSRELVEALLSSSVEDEVKIAEPDFGTARLRSAAEEMPAIPSFDEAVSPSPKQQQQQEEPKSESEEYIFTLPDEPHRSTAARNTGSIRRTPSKKATFGSKRGKAVLSLLNAASAAEDGDNSDLFASLPGATAMSRKKSGSANTSGASGDEEGWGGTLGRGSTRKSLGNVFDGSMKGRPKSMFGNPGTFRRRGLDRVASEAEGRLSMRDWRSWRVRRGWRKRRRRLR